MAAALGKNEIMYKIIVIINNYIIITAATVQEAFEWPAMAVLMLLGPQPDSAEEGKKRKKAKTKEKKNRSGY